MSEDEIRAQICEFGDRWRLRAVVMRDPEWRAEVLDPDDSFDTDMRRLLADVERKLDAIKAEES